ncbi:hypothetical protein F5Y14DRAFT_409891 [Nemania sp. NC0429]|nr:hypothetical protein F5Y14DRAFT_409891 [Nemania sp. NC0429]
MLSFKASSLLQRICIHPIWGFDIDVLRYFLGEAVKTSFSKKETRYMGHGIAMRYLREMSSQSLRRLEREMRGSFKAAQMRYPIDEDHLILTTEVMQRFVDILDEFETETYAQATPNLFWQFRDHYKPVWNELEPRSYDDLINVKWYLELCELRDVEIRKVLRNRDPENPQFLHDICQDDEQHKYITSEPVGPGIDAQCLAIYRGDIIDPKRRTLQALDRSDESRASDLDNFSQKLLSVTPQSSSKGKERASMYYDPNVDMAI